MVSVNRVTGLASGMDIDSIVKKMMKAEKAPQDRLKQNKQVLEWQRADYLTMNTSLSALRDKVSTMKLQSTFLAKKIDSTDSNYVTGTATADSVINSTMTIGNISQLATSARLESTAVISGGTKITTTGPLTSQPFAAGSPSGTISFTVAAAQADGTIKSKQFTYNLAGADSSKTLQDVMNDVNSAGLGVAMLYDSTRDKVVIQNKNTGRLGGASSDLALTDNTGTFLGTTLKLGASNNGLNASFTLNGSAMSTTTNDVTLNGVKVSLKQVSTPAQSFTLTVRSDVDSVVNTIKDFVKQYNDTIATLNTKISEKRYRDYPPLTDDQRSSMKDTDIKSWEDRAKSGLLHSDSTLTTIINSLRKDAYSPVLGTSSSTLNQLSAIGITSFSRQDSGKLYIDETKLRSTISTDPDSVMQMFTNISTTDSSKKGIAVKMYDDLTTGMNNIYTKAGNPFSSSATDSSSIGKLLRNVNTQILNWTTKLSDRESKYYKKFSAMETAINKMNAQSSAFK